MDLIWINVSEKLLEGVKHINTLDDDAYSSILSYIYKTQINQDVDGRDDTEGAENSVANLEIIKKSCNLKSSEFSLLVKTLQFITKRAINFIMKPTKLQSDLKDRIKLADRKTEIFLKNWITQTKPILDELEGQDGNTIRLEDLSWNLKVQLSSAGSQKEKTALGCIEFVTSDKERTNLVVNHNEILQLYECLENVQIELDLLKK